MDNYSYLEFLPNEILLHIFEYLEIRVLFQAFYNLNFRFNTLLQSLTNLCLTLRTCDVNYKNFACYVQSLKLYDGANINLNDFIHLRHLQILEPSSQQLKQLQTNIYPYLKCLSIGNEKVRLLYDYPDLCNKIFTDGFPCLEYCYLFQSALLFTGASFIQSMKLKCLKVDAINYFTYQMILSACSNLVFFQFSIYGQDKELCFIQPHLKLKKMKLRFLDLYSCLFNEDFQNYFICVPNLEQLILYGNDRATKLEKYCDYKWLKLPIDHCLFSLHQITFYLSIFYFKTVLTNENILNQIQSNFKTTHGNRYHSKLCIDSTTLLQGNDSRYFRDYKPKNNQKNVSSYNHSN